MAESDPKYRRLTRARARTAFGIVSTSRSSLWLGPDHLLCIDTTGYRENYKRFYFRDIQALIVRKTSRWKITVAVWGAVSGLFGLFAFSAASASEPVLAYILGSVAGLFLLGMAVDWVQGPSCVCQLRTAVQVEELPALDRLPWARKVLARLRPLIAEAQGQFTPEQVAERMQELATGLTPAPQYVVDDPNAPPRMVI